MFACARVRVCVILILFSYFNLNIPTEIQNLFYKRGSGQDSSMKSFT